MAGGATSNDFTALETRSMARQGHRIWPLTDRANALDHPERLRFRRSEIPGRERLRMLRASLRRMARFSGPLSFRFLARSSSKTTSGTQCGPFPDSIVYTDGWKGYNALDVSALRHFRIDHSELFADKQNHINGIENFWNQAKRHMRRFNGVPKAHFGLFLKECEWRFNNSDPQLQLRQPRQWVKLYLRWLSGTAPSKNRACSYDKGNWKSSSGPYGKSGHSITWWNNVFS